MPSLSEADRKSLLDLARFAVNEAVLHERLPANIPKEGICAERCGVFVTLNVNGKLHGCIGVVEPEETLGEAIVRSAASAAKSDPRFPPLKSEELSGLKVEISLLSPLEPVGADAYEIGKHGLLILQGQHRGLLLPQVAIEHRLSREQFLEETCRKAGLPREAWRDPQTRILGFTCEVFSEERFPAAS